MMIVPAGLKVHLAPGYAEMRKAGRIPEAAKPRIFSRFA
jgi:hypothetical protein